MDILIRVNIYGFTDVQAAPETLGEYQAYELARGLPLHDLAREAGEWNTRNPA